MIKHRFLPKALADLISIVEYIAKGNPQRAYAFADGIERRCRLIAEFPKSGRQIETDKGGLRGVSFKNYLILYRETAKLVEILRVLHGARDIASLLEDPNELE